MVPNTYEGIKEALHDKYLEFVRVSETASFFIDEEGMLNGSLFNVPASIFAGRPLWGPVVLVAARPDAQGDSLPAKQVDVELLQAFAMSWQRILTVANELGQQIVITSANPDTVPPPRIVPMPPEWKPGDPWPTP